MGGRTNTQLYTCYLPNMLHAALFRTLAVMFIQGSVSRHFCFVLLADGIISVKFVMGESQVRNLEQLFVFLNLFFSPVVEDAKG